MINQAQLPINEGDEVGVLRIYEGDEAIDEVPLVALDTVSAGFNWLLLVVIALVVLYIATFVFLFSNVKKRQQRSGGSRPSKPGGKKMPAARASRPHQSGQQPQQKRPAQHKPGADGRLSKGTLKNPSVGSNAGRQGLEQRLKERQDGNRPGGGRR